MKYKLILRLCALMIFAGISGGTSAQENDPLKVLSYNILQGMRLDTTEGKSLFISWVKSLDPDILALEEAQKLTQGSLEEMARKFGHSYAVLLKEDGYPVALTSKYPIVNVRKVIDNMHHGFIQAEINGYHVMVVHFSPHKYWKRREEADLVLATVKSDPGADNWIIMGDFNALSPRDSASYTDGKLLAQMERSARRYTYHENLADGRLDFSVIRKIEAADFTDAVKFLHPEFDYSVPPKMYLEKNPARAVSRIDYIFVSRSLKKKLIKAKIVKDKFTDYHSDHYPVLIELER